MSEIGCTKTSEEIIPKFLTPVVSSPKQRQEKYSRRRRWRRKIRHWEAFPTPCWLRVGMPLSTHFFRCVAQCREKHWHIFSRRFFNFSDIFICREYPVSRSVRWYLSIELKVKLANILVFLNKNKCMKIIMDSFVPKKIVKVKPGQGPPNPI